MKWLRLYADMPDDPKIGTLNDAEFRTFIELLCMAAKEDNNGDTGCSEDSLNWVLRRNVTVTLQALHDRKLIIKTDAGTIAIKNWQKRQSKSDNVAERVKKHREKTKEKQDNTEDVTKCNVTCNDDVTKCNALDKSRIEKKREEEKRAAADKNINPPLTPPLSKIKSKIDFNDFDAAAAACCELLGVRELTQSDKRMLMGWCSQHDVQGVILPIVASRIRKYVQKNGEAPVNPLTYCKAAVAEYTQPSKGAIA